MARLRGTRENYDVVIDPDGTAPVKLMIARDAKGRKKYRTRYLPISTDQPSSIDLREWVWQPGTSGAGWSIETPASYQGGGLAYGTFCWLRRKGVALPAGRLYEHDLPSVVATDTGAINAHFEWGTSQDLYLCTGTRYVVRVANGTGVSPGDHSVALDLGGGGRSQGAAIFRPSDTNAARAYVGDPNGRLREFDGGNWSEAEAGVERTFMATVNWTIGGDAATGGMAGAAGRTADRLVCVNDDYTGIYFATADPKAAANWSAFIPIGDGNWPINSLIASNRVVWFGLANAIRGVDGMGRNPNLVKWLEQAIDPDGCRAVAYWADMIWAATARGLFAFKPTGERVDLSRLIQFGAGQTNLTPIFGRPRALAAAPDGLYVAYYDGTDSYVGCLVLDPDGSFRWSMAEAVVEGEEVNWLLQTSPGGAPRLWIGTTDPNDRIHLYHQPLPRSGDPELDYQYLSGWDHAPDWTVTLSRWNAAMPNKKTIRRLSVEADRLSGYNTIDVGLALDGADTFTSQGIADASPRWTSIPQEGFVRGTSAQIRLSVDNNASEPVVIRSVGVRYSPQPELTKVITFVGLFGEGVTLRNGEKDHQDPKTILGRLERLQDDALKTMIDPLDRLIEGKVEPGQDAEISEESATTGWTARVDVTISQAREYARFDIDQFDDGSTFS